MAEHVLIKEWLPGVSLFAQLALEGAGPHLLVLPHVIVQVELVDKVLLANLTLICFLALVKEIRFGMEIIFSLKLNGVILSLPDVQHGCACGWMFCRGFCGRLDSWRSCLTSGP